MASKSTPVQIRARVSQVQKLLLRGHTRSQIVRFGEKTWNISARQIDDYIKAATDELDEVNLNTAERNLAIVKSNLWELFRTHQKKKEPGSARQVLLDIAKLCGLDRIDINLHIDRPLKDLSDDALAAAMKEEG